MKTYYLHVTFTGAHSAYNGQNFWYTVEATSAAAACRLLDAFEAGMRSIDKDRYELELESISIRKARGVTYEPLIKE